MYCCTALIIIALSFTYKTNSLLRRLMVLIFASGVVVASTTLFVMIFLLQGVPGAACVLRFRLNHCYVTYLCVSIIAFFLLPRPHIRLDDTLQLPN